jgi:hypothetical protein
MESRGLLPQVSLPTGMTPLICPLGPCMKAPRWTPARRYAGGNLVTDQDPMSGCLGRSGSRIQPGYARRRMSGERFRT